MKRSAKALWRGNLKQGKGLISTESGVLSNVNYSFTKRFGDEAGTNPEELIAAAHSGCFAMAFSGELEKNKMLADSIDVKAHVSLDNVEGGWSITKIHLDVVANVPEADEKNIQDAANSAKANCPVSKLLKADITMDLKIVSRPSQSANL